MFFYTVLCFAVLDFVLLYCVMRNQIMLTVAIMQFCSCVLYYGLLYSEVNYAYVISFMALTQVVYGLRPRCIMGEIQILPHFDRDAVKCTTHGGEVKTVNKAIQCIYSVRAPWNCAVLLPSFHSSLQEANKIEF